MRSLFVSEIFYSLQGEGGRAGQPTVFIRLQGCKTKHACFQSGIKCDTEFESGREMSVSEILQWIEANANGCTWLTWTGGEPLDQLQTEHIEYFHDAGYKQALETSGLHGLPNGLTIDKGFDYITISPKVAEHVILKNFGGVWVNELRYVRHQGQSVPQPSISADKYYLSPHSNGNEIDTDNLRHCIALCLRNPQWQLSVQQHKQWRVL